MISGTHKGDWSDIWRTCLPRSKSWNFEGRKLRGRPTYPYFSLCQVCPCIYLCRSSLVAPYVYHFPSRDDSCPTTSTKQPTELDRFWTTCFNQHLRRLEAILDQMNEFLDRMQSSFTAKLSAINELLMVLVKV